MTLETVDAGIVLEADNAPPRDAELVRELHDVIRQEWSYTTREKIKSIAATPNQPSFLIRWEEAGDERVLGGLPAGLLKHGWGITALKTRMTFVAPITETAEADVAYRFEGDTEINPTYGPKPCEVCENREYVEMIEVELPEDEMEERIANDQYVPLYWMEFVRLCDECELPDEYTRYEDNENGDPDFDPDKYPDYNRFEALEDAES